MTGLRTFVKSILLVECAAIGGMLIAGAVLTWAEKEHRYGDSFFTYRIEHLDEIPAWFAAVLMIMAVNGFWMFRLSAIEGAFHTPHRSPWGRWGAWMPVNPLRLFAVNLVAIPISIGLFMVIRANCW